MMNPKDFENLVMSKLEPGPFKPVVAYNGDDDALEIVVSKETYRIQTVEGNRSVSVYVGRESGEVVGVRILGVSRFTEPPDKLLFQVHDINDGKVKVKRLFKLLEAIREKAKNEQTTLGIFIGVLEKKIQDEVGSDDECLEACQV